MSVAVQTATNDRLVSTLFVACLVHGLIIMGVSFSAIAPPEANGSPTLEVVLVHNRNQTEITPDEAHYISEQAQAGSGTTVERVRAQTEFTTGQNIDNQGTQDGSVLERMRRQEEFPNPSLIVTRSLSDFSLQALKDPQHEPQDHSADPLLARNDAPVPELISEFDDSTQLHSPDLRELFVSVNTRQSNVARYLAMWKKKIEQVGTLNFPSDDLLNGLSGNPTLEVAIGADGALKDVILRRSSEHPRIDLAAMRIVRLASPFEPFPAEIRREYDVLRFVYVWQFVDGQRGPSQVALPQG